MDNVSPDNKRKVPQEQPIRRGLFQGEYSPSSSRSSPSRRGDRRSASQIANEQAEERRRQRAEERKLARKLAETPIQEVTVPETTSKVVQTKPIVGRIIIALISSHPEKERWTLLPF